MSSADKTQTYDLQQFHKCTSKISVFLMKTKIIYFYFDMSLLRSNILAILS